jgi:hypothetical protein
MTEHPSRAEREYIDQLQATTDLQSSPIEKLLVLAQLQIEPLHQEAEAIRILHEILAREKCNSWAIYWLAYCHLHYLIDTEAIQQAKNYVESYFRECTYPNGALYMILAEIHDDLNSSWRVETVSNDDLPSTSILLTEVDLLHKSILLESNWVNNRFSLAWAYERLDRIPEAIAQLQIARDNVIMADSAWDITRYYFEILVTGRISDNIETRITDWLEQLSKKLEGP